MIGSCHTGRGPQARQDGEVGYLAGLAELDGAERVLVRSRADGGSRELAGGRELTPAPSRGLRLHGANLSARVGDLSGGQRRRLQLMLLLAEPNVLILDEPTNDVDTDMLTATEDCSTRGRAR